MDGSNLTSSSPSNIRKLSPKQAYNLLWTHTSASPLSLWVLSIFFPNLFSLKIKMAKKRKSDATRLDEFDRSLYTSFCSAANSLSQLYTQAMNHQRLSFQAGERHALVRSLTLFFFFFFFSLIPIYIINLLYVWLNSIYICSSTIYFLL